MIRQSFKNQRGTGIGEVLVYMGGFTLVWFAFYCVTDWIYGNKEEKIEARYEHQVWKANKKHQSRYLERQRGFGGYKAKCSGFPEKECTTL